MYLLILYLATLTLYTCYRLRLELHCFQQLSYRPERYRRFLKENRQNGPWIKDSDQVLLLSASAMIVAMLLTNAWLSVPLGLLAILLLALSWYVLHFWATLHPTKKPLVYTHKIRRLQITLGLLLLGVLAIHAVALRHWVQIFFSDEAPLISTVLGPLTNTVLLATLINICAFILIQLAHYINRPMELWIEGRFIRDAKNCLEQARPLCTVGITGSYGKTSVKNILTQLLSKKYLTIMTPESYNTPMGIVRTLREHLKPYHEYLVLEMGAREVGDIAEVCAIAQPDLALITSIGPQHLETFGSIEAVLSTKTELFRATKAGGTLFINLADPLLAQYYAQAQSKENASSEHQAHHFITYGTANADYALLSSKVLPTGTTFDLRIPTGEVYSFKTHLLGRHNVENLVACITVALHEKVSVAAIHQALYDILPLKHRLSIAHSPVGYTILDDAFNSNPVGSKHALEVLAAFPGNKKCIMTPGMIELGTATHELNAQLGHHIAACADYAVLVGPRQTTSILQGLRDQGFPEEHIFVVDGLTQGFEQVNRLLTTGDVLLIENDLPDLFNET